MGGSYSDEGGNQRDNVKTSRNAYIKSISNHRKNPVQGGRIERIKEWRQVLLEKLSFEGSLEIPQWATVKAEIAQYIKTIPDEQNVEWLINVQITSMASSTYCSQFSNREDRVLDLDKFSKEKAVKSQYSMKSWSQIETANPVSNPKRPDEKDLSTFCASPKTTARSQIFSSFQSKASAKKELRKNLLNQIKSPNHIVYGLMKHFVTISERLFDQYVKDLTFVDYSDVHEEAYERVVTVIKRFVNALKAFICWVYEDLLVQLEDGLDSEDISPEYVIESILYDKLFRRLSPDLISLIYKLLEIKHREHVQKFKQALAEKKQDTLSSYDDIFQRNEEFLLTGVLNPYGKVSKKLSKVRFETNPYAKFDVVVSLIDDMWNSVCGTCKDENQLMKLKEGFSMDIKIPILVYSIVQSQHENLFIERKFIEEFVNPRTVDASLGFTTFQSSIDFLAGNYDPEHDSEHADENQ